MAKCQARSALRAALPPNVQIITLHAHGKSSMLLRLAHQFGIGEDAVLSKPVRLDLRNIFVGFDIVDAHEVSLTANQNKTAIVERRRLARTRTHARTHACTHARMHAHTQARV